MPVAPKWSLAEFGLLLLVTLLMALAAWESNGRKVPKDFMFGGNPKSIFGDATMGEPFLLFWSMVGIGGGWICGALLRWLTA